MIAAGPWPATSSTDREPVLGELFGVTRDAAMARPVVAYAPRADLVAFEANLRREGHSHDEARILSRLAFRHLGADVARQCALAGSLMEVVGEEALEVPVELAAVRPLIGDDRLVHLLPGDKVTPFDGP